MIYSNNMLPKPPSNKIIINGFNMYNVPYSQDNNNNEMFQYQPITSLSSHIDHNNSNSNSNSNGNNNNNTQSVIPFNTIKKNNVESTLNKSLNPSRTSHSSNPNITRNQSHHHHAAAPKERVTDNSFELNYSKIMNSKKDLSFSTMVTNNSNSAYGPPFLDKARKSFSESNTVKNLFGNKCKKIIVGKGHLNQIKILQNLHVGPVNISFDDKRHHLMSFSDTKVNTSTNNDDKIYFDCNIKVEPLHSKNNQARSPVKAIHNSNNGYNHRQRLKEAVATAAQLINSSSNQETRIMYQDVNDQSTEKDSCFDNNVTYNFVKTKKTGCASAEKILSKSPNQKPKDFNNYFNDYTEKEYSPPYNPSKIPINKSKLNIPKEPRIFGSGQKVTNNNNSMQILERNKIAEIKRNLNLECALSPIFQQRMPPNNFINGINDTSTNDASVLSDNNSNADIEMIFEDDYDDDIVDSTNNTTRGGQQPRHVLLLQSIYEGRPPTIFFPYPPCCEKIRDTSRTISITLEEEKSYDLKYKSIQLYCVIKAFEYAGFKRTISTNNTIWNGYWGRPKQVRLKDMNRYQKINHFSGCWNLGRKDNLWYYLSKMKRRYPNDYNFIPNTYILSKDYERFIQIKEYANNKALWIMKPCGSSCGRGIRLINKKTKLKRKMNYLVQDYIANPHLINDLKYDLRVYVLVTSYDPLRIYMYNQGLARFATEKYTLNNKSLRKRFIHLTNWSVNKHSRNFIKNEDTKKDNEGSKWSFNGLLKKYTDLNIDHNELFNNIKDIIIKTIISVEPYMLNKLNRLAEHKNNCYELYGFDILIDSNLKPWLIEVNICPSLNSTTPLDKKIKTSLISDIMNIIGYQPYNKKKFEENELKKNIINNTTSNITTNNITEEKKYNYKNINDISDLNEHNYLQKLNISDWNILFETDEEYYRKGDFQRIFPNKENIDKYSKYFIYQRYANLIVWKWLQSNQNFLEKICKKVSSQSV